MGFGGNQAFGFGQVTLMMPSGHPSSEETLRMWDARRRGISCGLEGWSYLEIRGRTCSKQNRHRKQERNRRQFLVLLGARQPRELCFTLPAQER